MNEFKRNCVYFYVPGEQRFIGIEQSPYSLNINYRNWLFISHEVSRLSAIRESLEMRRACIKKGLINPDGLSVWASFVKNIK